jgi:fumarate reductase subunit C
MRRGSAGTSVQGSESQERDCEFLKGPITLAIDILTYNVLILHKDKYEPKFFVTAQKYLNIHVYMTETITFILNPVIDHQTLSDQVSHIFQFKSKIP